MAVGFRGADDGHCHADAVLQRCGRVFGRIRVLADDCVFPGGDVHCAEEGAEVEPPVGVPTDAQPLLPHDHNCRRCGVDCRGYW